MENLVRHIILASFSQERMTYIQDEAKVVCQSKDGRDGKVFGAFYAAVVMQSLKNWRSLNILPHQDIGGLGDKSQPIFSLWL